MAGRVTPFLDGDLGEQRVGARYKGDGSYGPVARVSFDNTWLYIITDDYEGSVVLHIETLPHLIKALRNIQKGHTTSESE